MFFAHEIRTIKEMLRKSREEDSNIRQSNVKGPSSRYKSNT